MIGKIFAHFLGNAEEGTDLVMENESCEELLECEDGEWVIINIQENQCVGLTQEDPLENLLIEHPSMSVYQMRRQRFKEEDSCDEDDDSPRPVPVRHVSWQMAECGLPQPCRPLLLSVQRARTYAEHRKLNRNALNRHNMTRTRSSPTDRRYGHFKQPTQRLYNY
ncbi:tumor protein p53-inducible nuclear protein 2 isoform X2 [Brachyhypopomus gauderio]